MSSTTDYPQSYLDENKSGPIWRTAIAFIVLETVTFFLRTGARAVQRTGWMWADIFMPLSWIFNLGVCTCVLLCVRYGAGKHMEAVSEEDIKSFTKTIYYGVSCVYMVAVVWPKLAILDLYLRIMIHKWTRIACYVTGAIMILNCVINIPIFIWQCSPFSELWNPVPGGHCDNTHAHFTWSSFADVVTDFVMLLLPIPMIWKLQQSWGVKIGIFLTFFVGNVGLATSIVRLVEFYYFGWGTSTPDETWISSEVLIWSVVEPGVYHLCACFITFRPLVRWVVYESPISPVLSKVSSLASSMVSSSKQSSLKAEYATGNSAYSGAAIPGMAPHRGPDQGENQAETWA